MARYKKHNEMRCVYQQQMNGTNILNMAKNCGKKTNILATHPRHQWKINAINSLVHSKLMINLLKPTGYMMHQQFNIQQLYTLPVLYLCVLYLSENKQRLVPLTA